MDVLRPVRSFGEIGPAVMLLGIVAAVVLVVLVPVGARAATGGGVASIEAKPAQGTVGSTTTVTGRNLSCNDTTIQLRWDGVAIDDADLVAGDFSKVITVPKSDPGPHVISTKCYAPALTGNDSPGSPTFTFTVAAPEPTTRPELVLGTTQGRAGAPLELSGTGYYCSRDLLIGWDSADPTPLAVSSRSQNGDFKARTTVPAELRPGSHRLSVRCADRPDLGDAKPFTVLAAGAPQLSLQPAHGAAGQRMRATGSGFDACAGSDAVLWIDARRAGGSATVAVSDSSRGFDVQAVVPKGLPAGSHTLHAACAQRADVSASAVFTVPAGGTGPTPADGPVLTVTRIDPPAGTGLTGTQWGVLLGAVLVLAGAGGYGLFRGRGPGWVGKHVTAHGRPGGPGSYRIADAASADAAFADSAFAGDPAARSHSIRLEPRPDPGTQHIEETER